MVFRKIIEERMRKGPILRRLREQFFKVSSKVLSPVEFEASLLEDLRKAKSLVVIISPFLNKLQVSKFLSLREIDEARKRGVKFVVVTRPSDKKEVGNPDEHKECIQMLEEKADVLKQSKLHFKSVIIDNSVIYLGSINPLSLAMVSYVPPDYMVRFESEALVDEIVENVIGKEKYESWISA